MQYFKKRGNNVIHSNSSLYTVNLVHVIHQCSHAIFDSIVSHIDGGAIGGLAGTDVCLLDYTKQCSVIMGIGQESLDALSLVPSARTVHMIQCPIVLIMHQYAYYGREYHSFHWAFVTLWSSYQ